MTSLCVSVIHRMGDLRLDVKFHTAETSVTALFGPSGSGKTTVLRCVAGLERCSDGLVAVGETVWQDDSRQVFVPTHRRPLGYVFQEASLFPHLNVRRNLEYGWRRIAPEERRVHFDDAVALLGVSPLLKREPAGLSGGERQRVAIARALLAGPRLLLMDEPLAALDQASKEEILPYLERICAELAMPILYVSHSLDEVARLADQVVMLEQGAVRACGPVAEIMTRLDLPPSHGDEAEAVVDATVSHHEEQFHLTYLDSPAGSIAVPGQPLRPGATRRVRIRARDVSIALGYNDQTSILNTFPARIVEMAEAGPDLMLRLDAGGVALLARVTRKAGTALGLKPDMKVFAQVKGVALMASRNQGP